ncbi:MAG: Gfo/Idh/MocA family oxidoreductase [Clostridia bacterium]|nr:Gfo/Idh/MocA family oxidoreductase [Clostridia bacterium]
MLKIGVIGYGIRINSIVKKLVATGEVELAAIMDVDFETVKEKYLEPNGYENINFYSDADEMLTKEKLDGVCIGTRCNLHTHYAMMVAKYNIPLFLEKPVCITYDELNKLKSIPHMNEKTVVSFPLRLSNMCVYVKDIVDSGRLGEISQVQAYNNVTYGRGYFHLWYRNDNETGGLFLQKATHDLDYINYILGSGIKPVCVSAMESKQIYKGNKPAGLKCKDCDERLTCQESDINIKKLNDGRRIGEYCCYAVDTGNHDSGSVLVQYDNGLHAVYTQNFVVREGAGKRGARIVGYRGTVEFDWKSGIVTVYHHFDKVTETHNFGETDGHGGGDELLCENFVGVMKGEEKSHSPLSEGILSAELCLAAKKSAQEHIFVNID